MDYNGTKGIIERLDSSGVEILIDDDIISKRKVLKYSEIEPISLSEYILFKNNFPQHSEKCWTIKDFILKKVNDAWFIYRSDYDMKYNYKICVVSYVHELQKFLRLINNIDDANIFKIK